MKTNIITKISTGLLVPIITLIASLSEISVHADEVKARYTSVQATAPENPNRYTSVQATAPESPTRYTPLQAKVREAPTFTAPPVNPNAPYALTPELLLKSEPQASDTPARLDLSALIRKLYMLARDITEPEAALSSRDPSAVLREIDLKVALKQYEKVAPQVEDIKLQTALGPEEKGLSDQQIMQWKDAQNRKQALLEIAAKQLRDKIEQLVAEANRESSQSSPPSMGSNPTAPLKTPAVK